MTVYVYTYGFRPSSVIAEQTLKFKFAGRELSVKADYRTALYDMITEVVDYDCYQLKKIEWELHREHYIVDIGTNVGVTALVLAQIPGAHVTCYEPDPENCAFVQRNLEMNGVANVRVFQAAVGAVNGTLKFQTHAESTGGHLAGGEPVHGTHTISVTAVNLDRVLEQCGGDEIDLIKCDCEGDEYALIDQITPAHAARIRNLSIEVHDLDRTRNLQTISSKLTNLGYQLSVIPDMWERSALHLLLARRPQI
ncbi:MAG: FkbM family methyltransferase [Candidatus Acidiferrales bacterium]|jgi:FkbM family methyltransferase